MTLHVFSQQWVSLTLFLFHLLLRQPLWFAFQPFRLRPKTERKLCDPCTLMFDQLLLMRCACSSLFPLGTHLARDFSSDRLAFFSFSSLSFRSFLSFSFFIFAFFWLSSFLGGFFTFWWESITYNPISLTKPKTLLYVNRRTSVGGGESESEGAGIGGGGGFLDFFNGWSSIPSSELLLLSLSLPFLTLSLSFFFFSSSSFSRSRSRRSSSASSFFRRSSSSLLRSSSRFFHSLMRSGSLSLREVGGKGNLKLMCRGEFLLLY